MKDNRKFLSLNPDLKIHKTVSAMGNKRKLLVVLNDTFKNLAFKHVTPVRVIVLSVLLALIGLYHLLYDKKNVELALKFIGLILSSSLCIYFAMLWNDTEQRLKKNKIIVTDISFIALSGAMLIWQIAYLIRIIPESSWQKIIALLHWKIAVEQFQTSILAFLSTINSLCFLLVVRHLDCGDKFDLKDKINKARILNRLMLIGISFSIIHIVLLIDGDGFTGQLLDFILSLTTLYFLVFYVPKIFKAREVNYLGGMTVIILIITFLYNAWNLVYAIRIYDLSNFFKIGLKSPSIWKGKIIEYGDEYSVLIGIFGVLYKVLLFLMINALTTSYLNQKLVEKSYGVEALWKNLANLGVRSTHDVTEKVWEAITSFLNLDSNASCKTVKTHFSNQVAPTDGAEGAYKNPPYKFFRDIRTGEQVSLSLFAPLFMAIGAFRSKRKEEENAINGNEKPVTIEEALEWFSPDIIYEPPTTEHKDKVHINRQLCDKVLFNAKSKRDAQEICFSMYYLFAGIFFNKVHENTVQLEKIEFFEKDNSLRFFIKMPIDDIDSLEKILKEVIRNQPTLKYHNVSSNISLLSDTLNTSFLWLSKSERSRLLPNFECDREEIDLDLAYEYFILIFRSTN